MTKEKTPNYELISLYEQKLKGLCIYNFSPIIVILIVGFYVVKELLRYRLEITPSWFFYILIFFLSLGIIGSAIDILRRFLNNFFSTRKKLKQLKSMEE